MAQIRIEQDKCHARRSDVDIDASLPGKESSGCMLDIVPETGAACLPCGLEDHGEPGNHLVSSTLRRNAGVLAVNIRAE